MKNELERIQQFYSTYPNKVLSARQHLKRPLTLAEKILWAHCIQMVDTAEIEMKDLQIIPDRAALRDICSQLTLLQFASCGKASVAIPASLHCDHFVQAESGAQDDLARALDEHNEIYQFLETSCRKFGIDFWPQGTGVLHQVLLENYAFPGGLLVGTDSYLSNAGGLGMLAISISPTELIAALVGIPCELPLPKFIGIKLTGKLNGWASAKDIGLQLLESFPAKAAAGAVIEFFGEGASTLASSAKATICNLLSEAGAVAVIFPYDKAMNDFLNATGRKEIANCADTVKLELMADKEIEQQPENYFSSVLEVDLAAVEPRICGPNGEQSWSLSDFAAMVREQGLPEKLSTVLIGSCVNSSYEDLQRTLSIARQAWKHGLKAKSHLMIVPGSEMMIKQIELDGDLKVFDEIGATLFASACGPCAGLWKRHDVIFGERNSILTTFNRATPGKHDANPGTFAFSAGPEIALAMALAGRLTFNPCNDALLTAQGLPVRFAAPAGEVLPKDGFSFNQSRCVLPSAEGIDIKITIDPESKRLQLLSAFEPWHEKEFNDMRPLVKAVGKVLVDQIFPAGRWQRFRGHLENVSESIYTGIGNAFRAEVGKGKNLLTGEIEPYSKIARDYKREGIGWIMIAEEYCGDGHSCEVSVMGPRYLGCKVVIAKSYATDYENSLKRQGVLTLSFVRWEDYTRIREDDLIDVIGLREFGHESNLEFQIKHADGTTEKIPLKHTYTPQQMTWFKAGSILNAMKGQ